MTNTAGLRVTLALVTLVAVLLAPARASAIGDPDLDWRTVETKHFRVHHPNTLAPLAERVARISESVHARLKHTLAYAPKGKTEVVLTDDVDSANGSATALPFNTVRLYATAPEDLSVLGDYDDWMLDLITHEHTHILHIDNISGTAAIINAILGKTYAPNQVQPRWIIEGLATLTESRETSAGRMRSSFFDMYMRADVLEDRIAGLDTVSSSPLRWPNGNLWYLYGSRFLGWITDVYGPNTMRSVSADYGSTVFPWAINRSIRRVTGKTYEELFEGFKAHLRLRYAAQMKTVEARGLREGVRLTHHGRNVMYPRFVPRVARSSDADELVYWRDDYNARPGIYRVALSPKHDALADKPKLFVRTRGSSVSSFSPTGDLYSSSNAPWKIVYWRDDLFRIQHGFSAPRGDEPERQRLTVGMRATAPDVSPDGRRIAFTVNSKSTTYLQIADVDAEGRLANVRDLVPSARFEQAYTPRFSPDGRFIAYSAWTTGGYRDIRLVDVAKGTFEQITRDRAIDANPVFSNDGKVLYFSSDRTGISNIYAYDIAQRSLRQVTNVRMGAYQPALSPNGKTLVYVGYTSTGFDLYALQLDSSRFLDALPAPADRPDPPPAPEHVPMKWSRYQPLGTVLPRNYSVNFGPGTYGNAALSLEAVGSDVAGFHEVGASLTADFAAPAPRVVLEYAYRRLPMNMRVRLFHSVAPRQNFIANGQRIKYDERGIGISSALSYAIPGDFTDQFLGLSYTFSGFRGELPSVQLDPTSTVPRIPRGGVMSTLRANYSFTNVEGSLDSAGAIRGFSFRAAVEYAGQPTGSDFSLYNFDGAVAGYVPMPWPGLHTLALRVAGGVAGGTYAENGYYNVGGYDFESNTLLDTITTGIYDGSFVLRGYAPSSLAGRAFVLQNVEYRFPIVKPDRGLSTLPLYLRRIDGNVFVDYGGAFNELDLSAISLFTNNSIINSPDLHTSAGVELWLGFSLGYYLDAQFRLGYARGFSAKAIPGGQWYFVASSAF
ncbi:MAG: PD40 domain-containing protein [Polyangiaceae bacterium]|nr:PD40 domain-containing protein [Polyangiaceae bacterium]